MRKALWLVALARQVAEDPGTRFPGRVTGVGPKGLFVTLDGSHVSGMVTRARRCPAAGGRESRGRPRRSSTAPATGTATATPCAVQVDSADVESGQLELALDGPGPERPAGARSGARGPASRGSSARPRARKKPSPAA